MKLKYLFIFVFSAVFMSCASTSGRDQSMELQNFDAKWNFDDPSGTQKTFMQILDEVNFDDHPEYHLELRTQIARTLGLQQKYQEAHATLDAVEKDLTPAYTTARIRYLLERGRVYNSSKNPEKSRSYFLEAWELSVKHQADYHAVDAAHMLGIADEPELQLEWNEKAVALAESSIDPSVKKWLGSLYNNIGWTYHGAGNYNKALEIFRKTYDWYKSQDDVKRMNIAEWSMARTHRSLGEIDTALAIQNKLAREMAVTGEEDGYVFEEIGECLYAQGEVEKAKPAFRKAWELLSVDIWLQQNEPERLERLKALGAVAGE